MIRERKNDQGNGDQEQQERVLVVPNLHLGVDVQRQE